MSTQFITYLPPPGPIVHDYLSSTSVSTPGSSNVGSPTAIIPRAFLDAMTVRKAVFVSEQSCSLDNEIDGDDERAHHWIAYASVSAPKTNNGNQDTTIATKDKASNAHEDGNAEFARRKSVGGQVPIATLRLVPSPHARHPLPGSVDGKGGDASGIHYASDEADRETSLHDGNEAYVKLGRLATVAGYRSLGLGRLLVNAALEWAMQNRAELNEYASDDPVERERSEGEGIDKGKGEWKGLVLVHSQVGAKGFWQGLGFAEDEELGTWVEEGIEHLGMWRRVVFGKS